MLQRRRTGTIEIIAGVMFSGKSEELSRRVRRALIAKKKVQVFKSHLDDRYGGVFRVSSHDGAAVRIILAGTDTDFRGQPFGEMGRLMAVAEQVDKLQAICVVCGDLACRNQRLLDGRPARYDSPTIMVGGSESYEARCRKCHLVPKRDEDQTVFANLGNRE